MKEKFQFTPEALKKIREEAGINSRAKPSNKSRIILYVGLAAVVLLVGYILVMFAILAFAFGLPALLNNGGF